MKLRLFLEPGRDRVLAKAQELGLGYAATPERVHVAIYRPNGGAYEEVARSSLPREELIEWVPLPEPEPEPESDPFKEWRLFIMEKLEARMGIPPSELETKRSSPCICIGPPSRNCPQHGSDE